MNVFALHRLEHRRQNDLCEMLVNESHSLDSPVRKHALLFIHPPRSYDMNHPSNVYLYNGSV